MIKQCKTIPVALIAGISIIAVLSITAIFLITAVKKDKKTARTDIYQMSTVDISRRAEDNSAAENSSATGDRAASQRTEDGKQGTVLETAYDDENFMKVLDDIVVLTEGDQIDRTGN